MKIPKKEVIGLNSFLQSDNFETSIILFFGIESFFVSSSFENEIL